MSVHLAQQLPYSHHLLAHPQHVQLLAADLERAAMDVKYDPSVMSDPTKATPGQVAAFLQHGRSRAELLKPVDTLEVRPSTYSAMPLGKAYDALAG